MTNQQSSRNCLFGVLLMLTVAISPIVSAQNTVSADILTEWVDDGTGNITHGSVSYTHLTLPTICSV